MNWLIQNGGIILGNIIVAVIAYGIGRVGIHQLFGIEEDKHEKNA